jgi:hypothetical protein
MILLADPVAAPQPPIVQETVYTSDAEGRCNVAAGLAVGKDAERSPFH